MQPSPELDFRVLLSKRLEFRRRVNPAFSIRAFAKQLKISHTLLSNVLSGKKKISIELAEQLCERMNLNEDEECRFLLMVICESINSKPLKDQFYRMLTNASFENDSDSPYNKETV